jgi:putative ABC transport system ATP-binding protein
VLLLRDICKTFRLPDGAALNLLKDVCLEVCPGTSIGILGRSGSGKSTLLSILGLIERADTGSYEFDGREVRSLSGNVAAHLRSDKIGFVFQRSFLLPYLSAAENVELPLLHASHVPSARTRRRLVLTALDEVGIGHRARHRPNQLSGGEQQLVALARSLVRSPAYVFADEPTGNLDPASGDRIVRTLAAMTKTRSISLVMVTHDHELALLLDRQLLLQAGSLGEMN